VAGTRELFSSVRINYFSVSGNGQGGSTLHLKRFAQKRSPHPIGRLSGCDVTSPVWFLQS